MSFNPVDLWNTMTPLAKGVCVLLILMSIYSLTVPVERFIYYGKAKKQSLAFATLVTGYLKKDQLQEAIDSSKRFKNSHLARVVSARIAPASSCVSSNRSSTMVTNWSTERRISPA